MNINGSCFCKIIAFKGEVDPEKCFACHCEDCQIFSGAPYRGVVQCEKTNLNIKGKPKEYIKIGSSGSRRIQSFGTFSETSKRVAVFGSDGPR